MSLKTLGYPIKITRYCPVCHRTTKHSYDGKTKFKCLSRVHDRNRKLVSKEV